MPFGDGTGPAGMGPMTGRGAGFCAGYGVPGYANRGFGRGGGFGWGGGGRGWRHRFWATGQTGAQRAGMAPPFFGPSVPAPSAEQELDFLKAQAQQFENALAGLRKRIEELEGASER